MLIDDMCMYKLVRQSV